VRFSPSHLTGCLLILLAISACSTVPVVQETVVSAPPPAPRRGVDEPVVESLVSGARRLGNQPVNVVEESGEPQPVTTTVPMTSNRLV